MLDGLDLVFGLLLGCVGCVDMVVLASWITCDFCVRFGFILRLFWCLCFGVIAWLRVWLVRFLICLFAFDFVSLVVLIGLLCLRFAAFFMILLVVLD